MNASSVIQHLTVLNECTYVFYSSVL